MSNDDEILAELDFVPQFDFAPYRWIEISRAGWAVLEQVNPTAHAALMADPGTSVVDFDPDDTWIKLARSTDPTGRALLWLDRPGLIASARRCQIRVLTEAGDYVEVDIFGERS